MGIAGSSGAGGLPVNSLQKAGVQVQRIVTRNGETDSLNCRVKLVCSPLPPSGADGTNAETYFTLFGLRRFLELLSFLLFFFTCVDIVIPGANNSGEVQARISAGESIHIIRGSKGINRSPVNDR